MQAAPCVRDRTHRDACSERARADIERKGTCPSRAKGHEPILLKQGQRGCNAIVDCNRTHKRRILFSDVLGSRSPISQKNPSSNRIPAVQAPTPFILGEPCWSRMTRIYMKYTLLYSIYTIHISGIIKINEIYHVYVMFIPNL